MAESRWRGELERLNRIIDVVAQTPVDVTEPGWPSITPPIDQAGVRREAESVMREILEDYAKAPDSGRAAMRGLVSKYDSFFWATEAPKVETPSATLRLRLIRFALIDQGKDPRDEVEYLDETFTEEGVSSSEVAFLRREIAQMASAEDRYGFGSTRSMLLRGYGEYGRTNAPEGAKRSWIPWRR